jgi:hypothetical protein
VLDGVAAFAQLRIQAGKGKAQFRIGCILPQTLLKGGFGLIKLSFGRISLPESQTRLVQLGFFFKGTLKEDNGAGRIALLHEFAAFSQKIFAGFAGTTGSKKRQNKSKSGKKTHNHRELH